MLELIVLLFHLQYLHLDVNGSWFICFNLEVTDFLVGYVQHGLQDEIFGRFDMQVVRHVGYFKRSDFMYTGNGKAENHELSFLFI